MDISFQRWGVFHRFRDGDEIIEGGPLGDGRMPYMFHTKREAQEFIKEQWGYIAKRKDLRGKPYGWRMPKPIRIGVIRLEEEKA